ncbi:MAG TPA: acyl-CoA dehydrogenase family protein [Acidimicrobiales bacterium]|jgi:alkylation response protein AidB-like acyl-CoA dehydrogenase|nr:acyl-CoA dehydrogenase family protein [Acidimicrobiales bacterium]
MDFSLSDEQLMLQETARQFVARVCPPERAKEWDEAHHYPEELFRGFAELGWFELPFPAGDGGGDGSAVELALLAEELGRASLDVAQCFILTLMAALTVHRWGSEEMRAELFPQIMRAERRLSISISEPDSGSDAAALRTYAQDKGDRFVVNGQKMWCTGAGLPGTQVVCYVRTDREVTRKHDGLSALLIDPTAPGVEVRKIDTLARHILGTYELYLDNVEVPKENLIGPLDGGWKVMLSALDVERVLISGGYVGAAQATVDEALRYAKERHAFGRPVGQFQALAHALADVETEVAAARLLVRQAAWMHANGLDTSKAGAMAKLKGSETYVAAARLGMQICAAHGFATESLMSFRYRESIVAPISGGTSQIQRNTIARSLGLRTY